MVPERLVHVRKFQKVFMVVHPKPPHFIIEIKSPLIIEKESASMTDQLSKLEKEANSCMYEMVVTPQDAVGIP